MIASVNAEKAKSSKLQNKIVDLEQEVESKAREGEKLKRISHKLRKQLETSSSNNSNDSGGGGGNAATAAEQQKAAAVKKVPESERLVEARQETNILKQQLKMAHSALSKEIGSDIPLSRVRSHRAPHTRVECSFENARGWCTLLVQLLFVCPFSLTRANGDDVVHRRCLDRRVGGREGARVSH